MPEPTYHIGVDIGTTAVKVVAFDRLGNILSIHSGNYDMHHPQPGWSEQNPEEIFFAVIKNLNALYNELIPAIPVAVSFSAAMHSLIAVDSNGSPISPCLIWADNRAAEIADQIRNSPQGQKWYQLSGVPVHAMSPFCKLIWIRQHQPDLFEKASKFLGIKDYVIFRLTGRYVVDTAIASATGLLNMRTLQWEKEILDYVSLTEEKLPEVINVKSVLKLRKNISGELLQIPDETPLVIGASDGACANLSVGSYDEEVLVVTIGTSSAVRLLNDEPLPDSQMRTFSYHARDQFYINGGGGNNGAVVLSWLKNDLMESGEEMARFLAQAEQIQPGAEGLVFLPYILGERAPIWNAYAQGVFFGLTVRHTRAHMIRAALEAVIFAVYSIGKVLLEKKQVRSIHATGGFARNRNWVQMLADIFNLPVILSNSEESSAWGAVLTGMLAIGTPLPPSEKSGEILEPDKENNAVYMKVFEKYEELYVALKTFFVEAVGSRQ